MKNRMNKKTALECIMGVVLVASLVCFYAYSQELRISFAKELKSDERQTVHFRMDEEDWSIPDMWEYYSSLSYISQERFANQQCGSTNELLYCAAWAGRTEGNEYVPMGIQVTGVTVLDTLPEEYIPVAEEAFSKKDSRTGVRNWNRGVLNPQDRSELITRERLEELTQYVLVDVTMLNPSGKELSFSARNLCLSAIDELGIDRPKAAEGYHTYSASGKNALIECDQPLDEVGVGGNAGGDVVYYRKPVQTLPKYLSSFYVEQETHLTFLYVLTNEELADGNLAFCSLKDRGGEGKPAPSNEGFAIRLQEEIAYDAQDDAVRTQ